MAGRRSLRWRLGDSRDPRVAFRRGELAAGLATAAIAGQLLFAPAMLLSATALVVVGRVSRWRPHWLAVATAASVIWLFATGLLPAVGAFAAASRHLAGLLLAAASQPRTLAHPGVVAAGAARWSAMGLPPAMVAACGEAWLVLWLGWLRPTARLRTRWQWRPGLVAAVRRRMSAAALRAGHTVTRDGCAVGVATETGKLASFTWAEARHGVLLTGADGDLSGLAITCAALRRRKTVVIIGCAGLPAATHAHRGRDAVVERVGRLSRSFGVPVTVAGAGSCATAIGRAVRRRETVLIPTGTQLADEAQRAAAQLAAVLSGLRDLGLRADCVTWLDGVELMDPASVGELLALAPLTGTVMVVSTADSAAAAHLASAAAVVAVGHPVGADLELALAARLRGSGGADAVIGRESGSDAQLGTADPPWRPMKRRPGSARPGRVTMIVSSLGLDGSPRVVTHCRLQPITLDHPR